MSSSKQIKADLDQVVEAVSKVCAQSLVHSHRQVSEESLRTALDQFVVCSDCDGTKVVSCGWDEADCPSCTPTKGGSNG